MAFVFDFFWDPKKKRYGIYAISYHYELPKQEYFKSRKTAIKEVKKRQKVANILNSWNSSIKNKEIKRPPGVKGFKPHKKDKKRDKKK